MRYTRTTWKFGKEKTPLDRKDKEREENRNLQGVVVYNKTGL